MVFTFSIAPIIIPFQYGIQCDIQEQRHTAPYLRKLSVTRASSCALPQPSREFQATPAIALTVPPSLQDT